MKRFPHTLTLTLRPHVVALLHALRERTAAALAPERRAALSESVLLRYLIKRNATHPVLTPTGVAFGLGRCVDADGVIKFRDRIPRGRAGFAPMVNMRVRIDDATLAALLALCEAVTALMPEYGRSASQSRAVAALIASALYRDDTPPRDPDYPVGN